MINLRALKAFVLTMEEGTLAAAAARMHLSQSAASRFLSLLEQVYGVTLFERVGKRLAPTVQAEAFYPEAVRLLAQVEGLPAFFETQAKGTNPPLRIICQPRLVNGLVLPAITSFRNAFPGQTVKLDVQARRDLGRRMMQGLFDIGVSALPVPAPDLDAVPLGDFALGVLLACDHPLAGRQAIDTCDLTDTPYVALDESTVVRKITDRKLAETSDKLIPSIEVSTGSAAYRLVANGSGFTFADRIALDPELREVTVIVPWQRSVSISIGAVVRRSERANNMVEQFVEILKGMVLASGS